MNVRRESIILYILKVPKNYSRRKPTVIFIFSFFYWVKTSTLTPLYKKVKTGHPDQKQKGCSDIHAPTHCQTQSWCVLGLTVDEPS